MLLKHSISTLSILLLFTFSLLGQDTPEAPKAERGFIDLKTELGLTDEQDAKMKEIHKANQEAMREIFKNEDLDLEQKKAAIGKLKEEINAQLSTFLNEEQMAKYGALQTERKELRHLKRQELRQERKERMKERKTLMKEKREKMKAQKKAFLEYKNKNIDPVLKEQRQKLELKLSEEDKGKIEQIRQKRVAAKEAHRAEMKEKKEEMKKRKKEVEKDRKERFEKRKKELKERKLERKEMIKEKKAVHEADQQIIDYLLEKYEDDIEDLMEEIEDKKAQWKEDISKIKEMNSRQKERHQMRSKKNHIDKEEIQERKEKAALVRFLLLDPEVGASVIDRGAMPNAISEFNVYPNPAKDFNTLQFNLLQAGNVQIGVYEEGGRLVKTVVNEFMDSGDYELNVNIDDLNPGYYIYSIKTDSGVLSKRILVAE